MGHDFGHRTALPLRRYNRAMRPIRILLLAGLLVWALSGITVARSLVFPLGAWAFVQVLAWLIFGAAFFAESVWATKVDFRLALLVQTASALALIWAPWRAGIEVALLAMIAGQLPGAFSMRTCVFWVLIQTALAFVPEVSRAGLLDVAVPGMAYLSFQLFAIGAAGLAESERRAREELASVNGRLEALHERLAETSREAERLRIARELHDSLGHHLTALALDLELARHLAKGEGLAPVERARALASSLMSELRGAVSELRADSPGDFPNGLHALARAHGKPRVEVEIGQNLGGVPPDVALALTRVAQEIVTNATKHSRGTRVSLALRVSEAGWILEGRDDGVGMEALRSGHGLSGMRERVEGVGGVLKIVTQSGQGFAVTASVPTAHA